MGRGRRQTAIHDIQCPARAPASCRAWLLAGSAAALLATPPALHAQAAPTRAYAIPAGPLEAALTRFSLDSGVMLSYQTDDLVGRRSPGVQGNHAPATALQSLLAGTGLAAQQQPNGGYTLRPAVGGPAPAPTAVSTTVAVPVLPTVRVTATRDAETGTGPVAGYVARRSTAGTKTDTPLIETPQSVSVVTRDQMDAQNAHTLQDVLGYSPGISQGAAGRNPAIADSFYMRGFQLDAQFGSFYRDGMRFMSNIYNGQQELYGLERVEVLRGPASILYGATAPGGVVNTVTKRPQRDAQREVQAEIGSHGRRQLAADFTGPLDADGVWTYRLTVLGRESGTFIDAGKDDRGYIAPALRWQPSAATSVTLLASWQWARQSDTGTLPLAGTLRPGVAGEIPRNRYLGDPDHNRNDTTVRTFGYLVEHAFNDDLRLSHKLRRYDSTADLEYFLMAGLNGRTLNRQSRAHHDDTGLLTSDTHLQADWRSGAVQHQVLLGLDYLRSDFSSVRQRGSLAPIDVYAPVHSGGFPLAAWRALEDNRRQTGLYLQDQIKFGEHWVGLLGVRHDRVRLASVFNGTTQSSRDSATTGRAGLVYLAGNGWAPYASYSQSFNPTEGTDAGGRAFAPDKGEQFEVGVRWQPPGSETLLSAAVYQLTRQNVLTPDPVNAGFSVQTGEVRSRGLELEAKTPLGRHAKLIASYTYLDAVITHSNTAAAVGTAFPGAARHVASAWVDLSLGALDLPGWVTSAGVRYVSKKPGGVSDGSIGVPGYTLFDARLGYQSGPWSYALNIANLGDRRTIPSVCFNTVIGCDYGAPRSISLSAGYRW